MKAQAQQAAHEAAKRGPGLPPDFFTFEDKVAVFTLCYSVKKEKPGLDNVWHQLKGTLWQYFSLAVPLTLLTTAWIWIIVAFQSKYSIFPPGTSFMKWLAWPILSLCSRRKAILQQKSLSISNLIFYDPSMAILYFSWVNTYVLKYHKLGYRGIMGYPISLYLMMRDVKLFKISGSKYTY